MADVIQAVADAARPGPLTSDDIVNALGKAVGWIEDRITHGPAYTIHEYVSPVTEKLTRGSWPSTAMLAGLKAAGVEIVVNLCSERDNAAGVQAIGMLPSHMGFRDSTTPPDWILGPLRNLFNWHHVYIHCEQGTGRTGCVIAMYRVMMQQWTPAAALAEAEAFAVRFHALLSPAQKAWILAL